MPNKPPPSPTPRLVRITKKLASLRQSDRTFAIFGSDSHRYQLNPPLSAEALLDCEKGLGVQLPTEYRLFVTTVGHGGAGPYYGLFPLDDQDP